MKTHFSFTKPALESLPEQAPGERVIYHDTHKNAAGLQLRSTSTNKMLAAAGLKETASIVPIKKSATQRG